VGKRDGLKKRENQKKKKKRKKILELPKDPCDWNFAWS